MTLTIRSDLFYSIKKNSNSENIQHNPVISRTKKEVKRKGLKDISNEQYQLKTQKKRESARKATHVPKDNKENHEGAIFSNDMRDACKTICQICKAPVFLTTMRQHTRSKHKVTIDEYKKRYGNHRDMVTKRVYHKCAICSATILLDSDDIGGHLKKNHSISHKNYNAEYMVTKNSTQEIGQSSKCDVRKVDSPATSKVKDVEQITPKEYINDYEGREERGKIYYNDNDYKDDDDVEMTTDELLCALYLPYFLEKIM